MAQFPPQKLTEKEKIKDYGSIEQWGLATLSSVEDINGYGFYNQNGNTYEKQVLYDLMEGRINENDFESTLKPYGRVTPKYPVEFWHYDMISTKVKAIVNQEIITPFNYRVVAVNPDNLSGPEKIKKEMVTDSLKGLLVQKMAGSTNIDINQFYENAPIKTREEIDRFIDREYKDVKEKIGNDALNYIRFYNEVEDKFLQGYYDLVVVGEEVYYTTSYSNEPVLRRVNNQTFDHDRTVNVDFISESYWAKEYRWMSPNQIMDNFGESLDNDDINYIEAIQGEPTNGFAFGGGHPFQYYKSGFYKDDRTFNYFYGSNSFIQVTDFVWVSLRKIGFLDYLDEDGVVQTVRIDDEEFEMDESLGHLDLRWHWINEVWELTRLGDNKVIQCRPRPNQYRSLDNPNKVRLPYEGVVNPKMSLVKKLKYPQYFFNVAMWHLQRMLSDAKGKIFLMDLAQMPNSKNWGPKKWLQFFEVGKIALINSMQEGNKSHMLPKFNQFQSIDMTMSQSMVQIINMLEYWNKVMEDITGVTSASVGQISASEKVGNVESSIQRSNLINTDLWHVHSHIKKRVLTNLLEESKLAWINGKKAQFVFDDMSRGVLNVDANEYMDIEFAVFVENVPRMHLLKDKIEKNAEVALNSQLIGFGDHISVLKENSVLEAENIIRKGEEKRRKENMQMQQIDAQNKEREEEIKHAYKIDEINAQTEANIREMYVESSLKEPDLTSDEKLSILDSLKISEEQRKNLEDQLLKRRELDLKEKEINEKSTQAKEDNAIKKEELKLKKQGKTGI